MTASKKAKNDADPNAPTFVLDLFMNTTFTFQRSNSNQCENKWTEPVVSVVCVETRLSYGAHNAQYKHGNHPVIYEKIEIIEVNFLIQKQKF